MAFVPRASSRALSKDMCDGRMSGQLGEIRRRSNTGTPLSMSVWLSDNSASSDSTTPLPIKQRTCSRRMPEGIKERIVFLPPITSVCPALWPPWKRATAAARSMRRSTTLPLPSSPHWVPMTTTNLPTGCGSYRTRKRITTPTSMLPRPAMRNSRSPISSSFAKARFTPRGFRKGAMPSNTKNKPSAASRSVRFNDTTAPDRSLPQAALLGARMRLVGILQVLEELPVRRHDQQVAVLAERMAVRLQTAIEAIKLGILRIGLRVDRGGLCVTLTMHAQRVLLRVREDLGA